MTKKGPSWCGKERTHFSCEKKESREERGMGKGQIQVVWESGLHEKRMINRKRKAGPRRRGARQLKLAKTQRKAKQNRTLFLYSAGSFLGRKKRGGKERPRTLTREIVQIVVQKGGLLWKKRIIPSGGHTRNPHWKTRGGRKPSTWRRGKGLGATSQYRISKGGAGEKVGSDGPKRGRLGRCTARRLGRFKGNWWGQGYFVNFRKEVGDGNGSVPSQMVQREKGGKKKKSKY